MFPPGSQAVLAEVGKLHSSSRKQRGIGQKQDIFLQEIV